MSRLQGSIAVIVAMLLSIDAYAENTSKHHLIRLKCPRNKVHVRIFDPGGTMVDEFDVSPAADGTISSEDTQQSIEASKRYVVTSASEGCVNGHSGYASNNAPINVFTMPCNSDEPIDLVLTSDPAATFTVLRAVPVACRSQKKLNQGSSITYFTSDETLTIEARSINDPRMTGRLVLDWNHAPRAVKTTLPNEGYGAQGGSGAAPNAALARRLKSFTIVPKVSP
jgi:hypothetical protein